MSMTAKAFWYLLLPIAPGVAGDTKKLSQTFSFEQNSGVSFRHAASPTHRKHLPETMGSGVAVIDFDGDGRLDLFFVNGADLTLPGGLRFRKTSAFANRLYRNLGNWRFEDVTGKWGLAG